MKGLIFLAGCLLAVSGCLKEKPRSPLESFSGQLRLDSSTKTSPVSVTADFERNNGIGYLRFRLKNTTSQPLRTDPWALPWGEYDTTLMLVGFNSETGYQIYGVPPKSGTAYSLMGNPVAIAPGETLEGRIVLSEFFARDKQHAPAPTDRDLIVLWSYRFREDKQEAKGAPIDPGSLNTGVFLMPKK